MFTRFILALALCAGFGLHGDSQATPLITVKHLESMQYPSLARQARLQGSISIRLRISSEGTVVDAVASTSDALLREHPLLQTETVKLVRKWTFGCANCAPDADYDHVLIFVYRIEGRESQYNNSHFTIDLPDRVTVITNPAQQNW